MSGPARRFLDTNVLVYAFSRDPRSAIALELLGGGCVIGVQCLNEFVNVLRTRMGKPWKFVLDAAEKVQSLCPVVAPLDLATHKRGVALAERHGFSIYDAMIVAAALETGCDTLLTEDLHNGMVVEGRLRIENPFCEA